MTAPNFLYASFTVTASISSLSHLYRPFLHLFIHKIISKRKERYNKLQIKHVQSTG